MHCLAHRQAPLQTEARNKAYILPELITGGYVDEQHSIHSVFLTECRMSCYSGAQREKYNSCSYASAIGEKVRISDVSAQRALFRSYSDSRHCSRFTLVMTETGMAGALASVSHLLFFGRQILRSPDTRQLQRRSHPGIDSEPRFAQFFVIRFRTARSYCSVMSVFSDAEKAWMKVINKGGHSASHRRKSPSSSELPEAIQVTIAHMRPGDA